MKYLIVCGSPGELEQSQTFASTEEEAARSIERLVAADAAGENGVRLFALEEIPFKVEHVPTVTVGEGVSTPPLSMDTDDDKTVFEGFGPTSPHEHLVLADEPGEADSDSPDFGDLPPATTIDGEPVGEAEVFTFEA